MVIYEVPYNETIFQFNSNNIFKVSATPFALEKNISFSAAFRSNCVI